MTADEIITSPLTVWLAPAQTAFPALNEEPGAAWKLLGTSGSRSYLNEGVSAKAQRQIDIAHPAGNIAPGHSFLATEQMRFSLQMFDLTLEQYARALGQNEVRISPGSSAAPGYRTIGLARGAHTEAVLSLLARGPSPYTGGLIAQYEIPRCQEAGSGPQMIFSKGRPVGVAVDFLALQDPTATREDELFGRLSAQDAGI